LREECSLRVLSKLLGSERDEETGEWMRLHNEELNDLYWSPKIVPVIRSRKMRWARHVARMGRGEAYTGFWWGNLREEPRRRWEDNINDYADVLPGYAC
jgi:hypothetical protein